MSDFKIEGYLKNIAYDVFKFAKENKLSSLDIWLSLFNGKSSYMDCYYSNISPVIATIEFYQLESGFNVKINGVKIKSVDIYEKYSDSVFDKLYISYSKENCINNYKDSILNFLHELNSINNQIDSKVDKHSNSFIDTDLIVETLRRE